MTAKKKSKSYRNGKQKERTDFGCSLTKATMLQLLVNLVRNVDRISNVGKIKNTNKIGKRKSSTCDSHHDMVWTVISMQPYPHIIQVVSAMEQPSC